MGMDTAAKNYALDQLTANKWKYAALLNASDAELTGGTPAYARKAISFGAASGGQVALSAAVTFDVPAGSTVGKVAFFDLSTGGTRQVLFDVATDETYGGQGTYELATYTHNLNK